MAAEISTIKIVLEGIGKVIYSTAVDPKMTDDNR